MANTDIKIRRSAVPGKVPETNQLQLGELAINTYDGKLYSKLSDEAGESIFELGAAGPTGYTGSTGDTGATGYTGSTGGTGYDGSVGYTGSKGDTGYVGSTGAISSTTSSTPPESPNVGDVWVDSDTGIQYFYLNDGSSSQWVELGSPGSLGYTGSTGSLGYTGSFGATGYTGSKGNTGLGFNIAKTYLSVAALTADTSPTGIISGEFALINTNDVEDSENSRLYLWNGSSYTYVSDLSGAAGIQGPQGNFGYTGSKGDIGYTGSASTVIGYTGSQGDIGYTGSTGDQGIIGYTGSKGDIGYTGSKGDIGYTGSKGDVGYTGSVGAGYTYLSSSTSQTIGTGSKTFTTVQSSLNSAFTIGQRVRAAHPFNPTTIWMEGIITNYSSNTLVVEIDLIEGTGTSAPWGIVSAGEPGTAGYTGSKGDIGYTGSASTVIGYTGSQGSTGYTGSASTVVGYTGSKGDIGYTGSQGSIGSTGYTGSASTVVGYTGSTGYAGSTGYTGSAGTSYTTASNVQLNSLGIGTPASATTGEIRATNNVTAYYSSDRRLKENVTDIQGALDKVLAIGGKEFDWNSEYIKQHGGEDNYFLRKHDFGVIAQDVQAVFPVAVRQREDGTLAVDYEKLCALAFAAIIELNNKLERI